MGYATRFPNDLFERFTYVGVSVSEPGARADARRALEQACDSLSPAAAPKPPKPITLELSLGRINAAGAFIPIVCVSCGD